MSNTIKIAYNWIGPRGPIPNTEVPNILNLAAVTEAATTNSQKFWCDSIWHLIFCNVDNYDLSPITLLDQHDIFIYPFALTWRVPFTNYFYNDSGLLEYAHAPNQVLHHIRNNKGFILIEDSAEAHIEPVHMMSMHTYFQFHQIPLNKVIYLTGCMNGAELYEYWCLSKGYNDPEDRMNIIPFPISQDSLAIYFSVYNPKIPVYNTEIVPEKLFLSWNRRFREHRTAIGFGLNKLGLVDRSYMSMGLVDPENQSVHITHTINNYILADFHLTPDDIQNFTQKLPLTLDGETDNIKMCQDFDDATRPYYQNSLVSIVTETNFNANEVSLTEKSFKPMKEKHPFLSVGAPGTLRALKDMGFKTFEEFWDESYDREPDPRVRMTKILNICNDIGSWDNNKIIDFRRRVKPILEHNYEQLKVRHSTIVAKKIRERIYSILKITG